MFNIIKKNEKIMLTLMSLLVLISRCLLIYYMDGPYIYADEMGYWSHAANMAGLHWSIDGTAWYSYGYSLILAPLFLISHNMAVVYKLALLLNAVMGVISYLLCYSIAVRLAPKLERWVVGLLALVAAMYPAFIAQSYSAWAETELFMLVWLLLWLVLHYEERQSLWCAGLIGLTCGYLYLVHNRTIGIMVACAMIAVLMVFVKKMRWQDAGVVLLLLLAVYCINPPIKGILNLKYTANFMDTSQGESINTIAGGIYNMKRASSFEGMLALIYSIDGQLWYLIAASGMLFLWGVKACVDKILKEKEHVLFYSFTLLALAGMVAISTISMMRTAAIDTTQRIRLDPFFYGRYIECILGPVLLLGLLHLAQMMIDKKALLWYGTFVVLMIIMALVLGYRLRGVTDFYVQSCSVYGLEYYRWFGEFSIGLCTAVAVVLSLGLFLGLGIVGSRREGQIEEEQAKAGRVKFSQLRLIAACAVCILFWALTGVQGIRSFEMVEQRYTKQYNELFDYIKGLDADRIYVCGSYKAAADIQTRTVDKEVIRLTDAATQIPSVEDGNYLVMETETAEQYGLEICYEYMDYVVCRE